MDAAHEGYIESHTGTRRLVPSRANASSDALERVPGCGAVGCRRRGAAGERRSTGPAREPLQTLRSVHRRGKRTCSVHRRVRGLSQGDKAVRREDRPGGPGELVKRGVGAELERAGIIREIDVFPLR